MSRPVSNVRLARTASRAGFTLVEIMIVVAIIALLAAIAVPNFQRARERSKMTRFINDLRVFRDAFELYATERRGWPPDANPGEIPAGMAGYLPRQWTAPSIIGGQWEWDAEATQQMITAYGPTVSDAFMLDVDRKIDDGGASTGAFRKNGTEWNYLLDGAY